MRRLTTVAVLALALTACSGGDDEADEGSTAPDAGESSSEASEGDTYDLPDCEEVWQAGETLAADYEGCMNGEVVVVAAGMTCADGTTFYVYEESGEELYANSGGTIGSGGADSEEYATAFAAC